MASLYQIDQEIMQCVDAETGEIIDADALDALMMEREIKIEAVACWIKNLRSDALSYAAEKDAFAARQKAAENKAESLKMWLATALQGGKFSTAKCVVSFRKSEQVYIPDKTIVPQEYLKETITYEPDKMAIKKAIKAGQEISGCQLIEKLNTLIK